MKKKLFLLLAIIAILTCLFAITVNATDEVTIIIDGGTETVDFEEVFAMNNGYVAGFKDSTVYGKDNIQDVIFPETIVGFNSGSQSLFKESVAIKSITFKGTSVDMSDCSDMFASSSIESVIFEQGHKCTLNVHNYTKSVFNGCTSLTSIKFPTITKLNTDGTSDKGDALGYMFVNCTNMVAQNDIVFGEGVVSLGGECIFDQCSSLSNNTEQKCDVYFPSTIEIINHKSFRNTGITAIYFNNSSALTQIGDATYAEGTFSSCTNLTSVDFSSCTNLTTLCPNLFGGCTSLTTVTGLEKTSVATIPNSMFNNCYSLTGTYTFPNVTAIGYSAFKYAGKNEGTNLILNFPSVKKLGGSSSDTHVFSYSGVTELTFGDDIETMSFNTFTNCTRLWRIEFDGVADGFNFPSYTFENCSALKAFSIPEGVTTLPSRMFKSCSSLTAIYLPSTLTTINSGSQDHATFANCTNAYFVSSPFKYTSEADIPSKPDVYYFPSGITSIASGEVFKQCRNLNKTLVFPVGVTSISNAWTFEAGISNPTLENIVFLGDMVNINTSSWKLTGKIYFANANDKSSSDFETYTNTKSTVFCNAEGNTTHLEEKEVTLGATYLDNAKTEKLCFCGHAIETTEVEDTALFTVKGYSTDGTSIVFTIVANTDAIDAYNTVNGKNVKYGIVASKLQEDGALINKDGTIANDSVLSADFTGTQYTMLQIKIVGAASAPSTSLHCCAYVTDGTSVAYLYEEDKKATQGETANQVSYSQLAPDEQQ